MKIIEKLSFYEEKVITKVVMPKAIWHRKTEDEVEMEKVVLKDRLQNCINHKGSKASSDLRNLYSISIFDKEGKIFISGDFYGYEELKKIVDEGSHFVKFDRSIQKEEFYNRYVNDIVVEDKEEIL